MEFDLILKGTEEFYHKSNSKTYFILKIDNINKQNYMGQIMEKFIDNQNKNPKQLHFIGIDFEFNKIRKTERDIALMQINLENDSNKGYIFVLYPPDLNNKNMNLLKKLITHVHIYKILHGAESLDIPYLFNQLLIDQETINNFCSNFYDTRFLCDYYHLDNNVTGRCSIYYLLLEQNIISKDKLDKLEKIEEKTGPIYLINIDIYNLGEDIFKYSLYDVLYLPQLLRKFLNMGWPYKNLIPEITCGINKYKRNINNDFHKLEKFINSMNIFFIWESNYKISLNNIWEIYNVTSNQKYLNLIQLIPYFKKFIETIIKFIVYQNICNNFTVYINKNKTFQKHNWNQYWNIFDSFPNLKIIIKEFDSFVKFDISDRIK
jgi:hypothetical protein